MKFMDELKALGLAGFFTGLTVAQVDMAIRWGVGLFTIIYLGIKIVKAIKGRKENDEG